MRSILVTVSINGDISNATLKATDEHILKLLSNHNVLQVLEMPYGHILSSDASNARNILEHTPERLTIELVEERLAGEYVLSEALRTEVVEYLRDHLDGTLGSGRECLMDGVQWKGLNNMDDSELMEHIEYALGSEHELYQRCLLETKVDGVLLADHICKHCNSIGECEPAFCKEENQ